MKIGNLQGLDAEMMNVKAPQIADDITTEVARRSDSGMWPAGLSEPSSLPGWLYREFKPSVTGIWSSLS